MKGVVITGASTGIGYDAARYLIERGYHVFGSVRKEADAERLRQDFGAGITPLIFDVTDDAAIKAAAEQTAEALNGRLLHGLVNNAGIGVSGPLLYVPLDDFRKQLAINVTGALAVSQAFLPLLGARRDRPADQQPGRIINISSISGEIVYPFVGPYAASKHALEALSDALRRELMSHGIEVVVLQPGNIKTPIWDKVDSDDVPPLEGTIYEGMEHIFEQMAQQQNASGLPVERVSQLIYKALTTSRPKTRYVLVRNRLTNWIVPRLLPDRLFDWLAKRYLDSLTDQS